jgi:hypothetical protein
MLFGFVMGMTIAAFFYREGPSLMSRGIKAATFGLVKSDTNLHVENRYLSHLTKTAHLAQSLASQTIVNFIDTTLIVGLLCVSTVALFANSAELAGAECQQHSFLSLANMIAFTFMGALVVYFLKTILQVSLNLTSRTTTRFGTSLLTFAG